jgi:atypical dual specificity phosphatase
VDSLNFSWLIEGEIAGHGAPSQDEDLLFLKYKGIRTLVRLVEKSEALITPLQVENYGFWDLHEPIPEFTAPSQLQIDRIITFITESVSKRRPVGVSCFAGVARTGTILACYLVHKSFTPEQAMKEVAHRREAEIHIEQQRAAVRAYFERLYGNT